MVWWLCFLIAAVIFGIELMLVGADIITKKIFNHRRKVIYFLLGFGALISVCLCFPAHLLEYEGTNYRLLKALALSVMDAIQVFTGENIYENIVGFIGELTDLNTGIYKDYVQYFKIYDIVVLTIQLIAPFLTFGFVVSFLKNFIPGLTYSCSSVWRRVHVFSELNEKTLTLAKSVIKDASMKKLVEERDGGYKSSQKDSNTSFRPEKNSWLTRWLCRPLIVFTGCERNDEDDELMDDAREIGALIFPTDLENIKFRRKKKKADSDKKKKPRKEKKKKEKPKKENESKFALKIKDFISKKKEKYESSKDFKELVEKAKYRIKSFCIEIKKMFKGERVITFYLTGENETLKIDNATHIIEKYDYKEVAMYVFSDGIECELLLSAWDNEYMQIYRVNDIQALVYHNLYSYGIRLFEKAHDTNGNTISAIIVGLGKYGLEMLKALVWYCQVPGFNVKITAFDADPDIEEKFCAQCPELMEKNRDNTPGEAHYDINIYGGVDVTQRDFFDKLKIIYDPTYIFVSLGSDEDNISLVSKIRSEYRRLTPDKYPDIETVVYDSDIVREMSVSWDEALKDDPQNVGITNFKGQRYDIHMIGDLESFYSVNTVVNSELIMKGMEVNERWGKSEQDKKNFWRFNYNYKSSIAKAIHESLREKLIAKKYIPPIKGVGKEWEDLTDEEKLEIGMFEHVRWNAYMRGEGYRYGSERLDIAKTHNNLVPVYSLSDEVLRKDA